MKLKILIAGFFIFILFGILWPTCNVGPPVSLNLRTHEQLKWLSWEYSFYYNENRLSGDAEGIEGIKFVDGFWDFYFNLRDYSGERSKVVYDSWGNPIKLVRTRRDDDIIAVFLSSGEDGVFCSTKDAGYMYKCDDLYVFSYDRFSD